MTELAVELLHLHRSRPNAYLYADGLDDRHQLLAIDRAYSELEQSGYVVAGNPKSVFGGVPRRTYLITEKGKTAVGLTGQSG